MGLGANCIHFSLKFPSKHENFQVWRTPGETWRMAEGFGGQSSQLPRRQGPNYQPELVTGPTEVILRFLFLSNRNELITNNSAVFQ